jgi:tetratricopeptide (TPR) repeat protein
MKRFGMWVGAVLFVLSASGWAAPAARAQEPVSAGDDAADRALAKQHFEAGVAAYEGQRYADALTQFQEAYRIKPHPVVRVNMANCYDRLGKPVPAIFHFEKFLEESDPNAAQRKEVTEALRTLRAKVGEVTLRIEPDGASVIIDGGERRQAPVVEPVRLEAGAHAIEVAASGYETQKRDFTLSGGQALELAITLAPPGTPVVAITPSTTPSAEPVAPSPAPAPAAPAPAEVAAATPTKAAEPAPDTSEVVVERPEAEQGERPFLPITAWVSGGATAAMLLGALITGQLALSAESDFEEARRTAQANPSEVLALERRAAYVDALEAADRADALALASDIFLIAGVIGAGVTTYFVIDHYGDGESASAPSATLTVSPTRVALSGSF